MLHGATALRAAGAGRVARAQAAVPPSVAPHWKVKVSGGAGAGRGTYISPTFAAVIHEPRIKVVSRQIDSIITKTLFQSLLQVGVGSQIDKQFVYSIN